MKKLIPYLIFSLVWLHSLPVLANLQQAPSIAEEAPVGLSQSLGLAVLDLEANQADPALTSALGDLLRLQLYALPGIRMIERVRMTDVLKEQNFQLSPHCGDSYTCLKEAGLKIDGQPQGPSPLTRLPLPAGFYHVEVSLPGYITQTQSLFLEAGQQVGKVPLSLSLSPGEYQLEIKQVGYQTWQNRLQIQTENTLEMRPELQREEPHWGIMIGVFSSLLLILAGSLLQRGPGQGLQRADMYITQQ